MNTFNRPPGPRDFRPKRFQAPPDLHRINHRITAKEVRVIADNGDQLGILSLRDALIAAEKAELDLVEVAPTASPPVCRLMDYGKFKYREQKKEAEAKKKRAETSTKELRIRYSTDTGDLETKLRHAREFLAEGNKVKFSMRFKGREGMYHALGEEKLTLVIEKLRDVAVVDERSGLIGRMLFVVMAPKPK